MKFHPSTVCATPSRRIAHAGYAACRTSPSLDVGAEASGRRGITAEQVRALLDYDPETGVFRWKTTRGGAIAGRVAGSFDRKGYVQINVQRLACKAHRLAWLYVHGVWPTQEIDHINGDPADNRLANLRDVSAAWNQQNRRVPKGSRTGVLGVTPRNGRFAAQIWANGTSVHLGMFDTVEEASAEHAKAKLALHPGSVKP